MPKPSLKPIEYLRAFGYALEGLYYVITHHASFTIQVVVGLITLGLGFYFKITRFEWMVLIFVIFTVLTAELLNTAVETTLDYMAHEHHIQVKKAKDVAAGAVFLIAVSALIIGIIIFFPYL